MRGSDHVSSVLEHYRQNLREDAELASELDEVDESKPDLVSFFPVVMTFPIK